MTVVPKLSQKKSVRDEVLYGVSWEQYEELVKKYWNQPTPRLTYDSGMLIKIISNSSEHETESRNLARLVETVLLELEIEFTNNGSTTFTRKTIFKGFEPDSCFYIESLKKIEGEKNFGIENKIPPDLILEVNRTSSSVPRMPVFAAFGVKEVWRLSKNLVKFYKLEDGIYLESETSLAIPILTSAKATEFLLDLQKTGNIAWAKKVRNWVSEVRKSKNEI